MDYSSQILKKTKTSRFYMNGYRILRYELKGLFYLVLAVLLVLLWQTFFHDSLFRMDVWLYLLITVLSAPFLYCCFRPVRLMEVIRFLDNQLKLQQRLETFIENLEKGDDVINLQRKDTFHFLKSIDMASVIKFRWPFEARIIPFILFLIFLLFAGKGLFDSERIFVTGLDKVKEEDVNYQIVKNPFKNTLDPTAKKKDVQIRRNANKTRKIFKTSAGDFAGLSKLRIQENDQIQSKFNVAENKTITKENQQKGEDFIEHSQTNKMKRDITFHAETKILKNPADKADSDRVKKSGIGELSTKYKAIGSTLTEADVTNAKNRLSKKDDESGSSRVNNTTAANDNGSAGIGSSSVNKDTVKRSMLVQHSFAGDMSHIDEMIINNSVQPSLREYVKKYFMSLR